MSTRTFPPVRKAISTVCAVALLTSGIVSMTPAVRASVATPVTSSASSAPQAWLTSVAGRVFRYGSADALTPSPTLPSGTVISDTASTDTGAGLWMTSVTGKVYSFGDAPQLTSAAPPPPRTLIVAITPTVTGAGAWLTSATGNLYRFGDAPALTAATPPPPGTLISDAASTPSGAGLWMTSVTGKVYSFGDAPQLTSVAPPPPRTLVVAITPTVTGAGAWLTSATGNLYRFGDAPALTAATPPPPGTLISDAASTPSGAGLWMTSVTGKVYSFGDAPQLTSVAPPPSGTVIVSIATPLRTSLTVTAGGPSPVLTDAPIDYTFSVLNTGTRTANLTRLTVDLPGAGTFVSSVPPSTPAAGKDTVELGSLMAGSTAMVKLRWTSPSTATTLHVTAHANAQNAPMADSNTLDTVVQPPPPPPPPPDLNAPPLDATVSTPLFTGSQFLYSGTDPPQLGVVAGTIAPAQAAVVRGRVLDRADAPLADVQVRVLDHPEYGHTTSRADGRFDMAVNGGAQLVLDYQRSGYLPVHRPVEPSQQDFTTAPDVVLVALDPSVTAVDLAAATTTQVARGTQVSDSSGSRQATLLFAPGTQAMMTLADGTQRAAPIGHVRATEFTVGPTGQQAMPGALPPSSGYTYAVDYSLDEATAAGASRVTFDRPVISYLENFLRFPAGTPVPSGSYDRSKAAWLGADNGRVVTVLGITNGLAQLDTTGGGSADNGAAIGVTDAERTQLATLYTAGQSLWRIPIDHFSAWDANWGTSPTPPTAKAPEVEVPKVETPTDCKKKVKGSIIECENQILGERLGVVGTPYQLTYDSSRTPGRRADRTVRIPLTGSTVPAGVLSVEVSVSIAGQRSIRSFPATPNQSTTFVWDGKDAYGRTVLGRQPVHVSVGYTYAAVYVFTDRFGYNGRGVVAISGDRARSTITLAKEWTGVLGAWDARATGLGGWDLSVHHAYDPLGKVLYRGDGTRRSADGSGVAAVLKTVPGSDTFNSGPSGVAVAPDGTIYLGQTSSTIPARRVIKITPAGDVSTYAGGRFGMGGAGDGGPASLAGFRSIYGIALGPDGSLYIADSVDHRVRRVSPGGIISTFAGNSSPGLSGDDGPAVAAQLHNPSDVAVGPDGAVFIADVAHGRIRRVTPDGIISTYAGLSGSTAPLGDGGPATSANLSLPLGIDVGPDGTLYIADNGNLRIRKVTPNGIITTVAGNGARGGVPISGNGGPATSASLVGPSDVVMQPSGALLLVSNGDGAREVGQDGIIRQVVKNGTAAMPDGAPAALAQITSAFAAAVGPDGAIYISQHNFPSRLVKVSGPLPGFSGTDIAIPSEDGSELYQFNVNGRHLRTVDTLTGTIVFTFGYDAGGRLASVTDRDNNVTTVERDGTGSPTTIVGPYGQRTALTTTPAGYLSSVTNPRGDAVAFTYGTGGLLGSMIDPRGGVHAFTYDGDGLLTADADPTGATQRLARTTDDSGHTVTLTSARGNATTYRLDRLATGGRARTMTNPAGLVTRFTERSDGGNTLNQPDGTTITWQLLGDPRFGMLSPVTATRRTVTPSGLARLDTTTVSATLTTPGNPLSLSSLTTINGVNGRNTSSVFTAATRIVVTTSPAGRKVTTTLDSAGRVASVQAAGRGTLVPTYDTRGRPSTLTQSAGTEARTTTLGYDALGRLATVTDPLSQVTRLAYDVAGNLTSQTRPDGAVIFATHDARGNVTSLTPPGTSTHNFAYTALDQTASYNPPPLSAGGEPTAYEYSPDRQLSRVTRPDTQTIDLAYDRSDRLTSVVTAQGPASFTYDQATGTLSGVSAPGGVNLALGYDGALLTTEATTGPVAGSITHSYDSDFRTSSINSAGVTTATVYDADGLRTAVGSLTLTRDPSSGQVSATALGGISDSRSYDGFGDLNGYSAALNGVPVLARTLTRDPLGRITTQSETIDGVTHTKGYSYDPAGRLTVVTRDGISSETYTYDDNGNRRSGTVAGAPKAATYDAQDRLTTYGSTAYGYTAAGELRTRTDGPTTTTYGYDALGNLRSVDQADGTQIEYLIDGWNRRVGKKVNGVLMKAFLYQDGLRPVAELDGGGNVLSRFVYSSDGSVSYMVKAGRTYRVLTDMVGSPRLIIDVSSGSIVERMDYDAFGNVTLDTNPGFQPFGFAGGLYDQDTHLTRFGARDFDPATGRWTTKDPSGFSGGDGNLYAYSGNDPVNRIDRTGLVAAAAGLSILAETALLAPLPWVIVGAAIIVVGYIAYKAITEGESCPFAESNDGRPRRNRDQNRQSDDAKREIERRLGRPLNEREREQWHREAGRRLNPDYHDLIDLGNELYPSPDAANDQGGEGGGGSSE